MAALFGPFSCFILFVLNVVTSVGHCHCLSEELVALIFFVFICGTCALYHGFFTVLLGVICRLSSQIVTLLGYHLYYFVLIKRKEGNSQESIQLPNTFRPRHKRERGTHL